MTIDQFMTLLPYLPLIVFLIILEGLFSGGEIALVSCDNYRILQKAQKGSRSARVALKLIEKPERFLSTTLTGTNLCQISNTALVTNLFISLWGSEKGAFAAIVVMVPLLLVTAEIIPKSLFQHHADSVAPRIALFIKGASWIFHPVVVVLSCISRSAVYVVSKQSGSYYTPYITRSGLESLLQAESESSDITEVEKEMIQRVLDFSECTVEDVMVPISNVAVIPLEATLGEAAAVAKDGNYSRIPVYEGEVFNIVGIIDAFDLMDELAERGPDAPLEEKGGEGPSRIQRDILFVPETKQARELFFELQHHGEHMAVVVDEYGGAVGIITLEDIQEEIVGEINEEGGEGGTDRIRQTGRNRYLVDGRITTEYLKESLGIIIPEGDYETLGGYLMTVMGKIPKPRETYRLDSVLFVVEEADARSVKKVLIVLPTKVATLKKERSPS